VSACGCVCVGELGLGFTGCLCV